MNMPGFTAEGSLYKTNGHYQTSRPAFTSVTKAIRAFHPAAEVIEVHGCPPGFTMVGAPPDDWYCFPDPLTEPGSGGGGGTPAGEGGGGGFGGGNKPSKKRPKRPRPNKPTGPKRYYAPGKCTPAHAQTEAWQKCAKKQEEDLLNGVPNHLCHAAYCGDEVSEVLCCTNHGGSPLICDVEQV